MGSYTTPSGGGGGAIYKDGEPVDFTLRSETTTVPDGETWVLDIATRDGAKLRSDGEEFKSGNTGPRSFRQVFDAGTSIQEAEGEPVKFGGWSV